MEQIACRIFKEQIDLINQLPEQDRATVLYLAVTSAFNQIENQTDIQNENQFDNQTENQIYLSLYLSLNNKLSNISKSVLELLKKNIVCRKFSENYGGSRKGAGRPKAKLSTDLSTKISTGPKVLIKEGEFYMDETNPEYRDEIQKLSQHEREKLWQWIMDRYYGKELPIAKIKQMIHNFGKREFNE